MTTIQVPDAVEAIDMSTVRLMVIVHEDGTASLRGNLEHRMVAPLLRMVATTYEATS